MCGICLTGGAGDDARIVEGLAERVPFDIGRTRQGHHRKRKGRLRLVRPRRPMVVFMSAVQRM